MITFVQQRWSRLLCGIGGVNGYGVHMSAAFLVFVIAARRWVIVLALFAVLVLPLGTVVRAQELTAFEARLVDKSSGVAENLLQLPFGLGRDVLVCHGSLRLVCHRCVVCLLSARVYSTAQHSLSVCCMALRAFRRVYKGRVGG